MLQHKFDINKFKPFQTSSGLDSDVTGIYEDKVVRIIPKKYEFYKTLLQYSDELFYLIKTKIFYENHESLILEHEKLEHITYYIEWTKKQRVIAAKAIVLLQSQLIKKGYYLNDPHAFNITFKYHQPVYFDFGSIKKGNINPVWWFIKCFCGWTAMDYWDSVLNINKIQKCWIATQLFFSSSPYEFLRNKISKYEMNFFEKRFFFLLSRKGFTGRVIRKLVNSSPKIFKNFSNWTDYEQKSPSLDIENIRNKNILRFLNQFKPKKVLDIGANKGAYSLLALENGADETIAVDLDNFSLDYLYNEINKRNCNITIAKLDMMNYPEHPGYFQSYLPAHQRLSSDFTICLAVVHHVCYFGNKSFEDFSASLNRFTNKTVIVEFVPYDDDHLTGAVYKGKDRSWYTLQNFISAMKKHFPDDHEILESFPTPRLLIKFSK